MTLKNMFCFFRLRFASCFVWLVPGCLPAAPELPDHSAEDAAWLQVGWGEEGFQSLQSGDPFEIVLGGQGSYMFPMAIRAGNFTLPDDPSNYLDPEIPLLDVTVDVEGYDNGIGGHFIRVANYPIPFDVLTDGTYEFSYVALILPSCEDPNDCEDVSKRLDPMILDGLTAKLHVALRPYADPRVELDLDLVVRAPTMTAR